MRSWLSALFLAAILCFSGSGRASDPAAIRLADSVQPGGLVIGKAAAGSAVHVDDRRIRVSGDGRFVFGVGRDAKGTIDVRIKPPQGNEIKRIVGISERDYKIQRIDGLPSRKVEPNPDDQAKIEEDWILLNRAKSMDSDALAFADKAVWPVIGPISGVFGSQRILNGKPKSPHRGVDVAASHGTAVSAMLDGIVTIATEDMYFTGGTVMVDHGHGVQSLYAHLASIDVQVGQRLTRGEPLGTIGSTGRATGPHLHLSLYWFRTALDPALILGPMPNHQPRFKPSLASGAG